MFVDGDLSLNISRYIFSLAAYRFCFCVRIQYRGARTLRMPDFTRTDTFSFGNTKYVTARCSRQRANVLSFSTETKTKAPAISFLRAPSRSRVYCRTKISRRQSRDRRPLSRELLTRPAPSPPPRRKALRVFSRWRGARGGDVTRIRDRAGVRDARSSRSCLPIKTEAGNWRVIDWLRADRIKQRTRPFARIIYMRGGGRLFAPIVIDVNLHRICRLPVDDTLTRKDDNEGGFLTHDYRSYRPIIARMSPR